VVKRLAFAVPGDLDTPTGGYVYDRRIIAELRRLGYVIEVMNLGDGFPRPSSETKADALAALEGLPRGLPVVIDGLAYGVLPELADRFCQARPVIALLHHPLALETGLSEDESAALLTSERTALAGARRVIVTSEATARLLASNYGVPHERVTVALPGTDRVAPTQRKDCGPVALLSVGSLVPRKGYDVLIAALAEVADLDWRIVIAGPRIRDEAAAKRIAAQIASLGLGARVTLAGAVAPDRLAELYATADLFVLASRFEGYGMAFAEAIGYGLPVIGTTAGAIPETVPVRAGLLVPSDDVAALAAALRRLIGDREERERLATAARAAADQLPTWEAAARLVAAAIDSLA
jgi:glycosyltransferase involved in cell wall biosynthesis